MLENTSGLCWTWKLNYCHGTQFKTVKLDGPSSVPLWTQKYALEECLAVAVLLLHISQLQH